MGLSKIIRYLFFAVIVKPVVWVLFGVISQDRALPKKGPAVIAVNHNSHLDTLVLISMFPLSSLKYVQPVAAADYFLSSGPLAWFTTKIIGIIPITRKIKKSSGNVLAPVENALDNEKIVIIFPEGSRGEPEQRSKFKGGIAKLTQNYPNVDIYPVFLFGLGKSLPRGEKLLVPFNVRFSIGRPIRNSGNPREFTTILEEEIVKLEQELNIKKEI